MMMAKQKRQGKGAVGGGGTKVSHLSDITKVTNDIVSIGMSGLRDKYLGN